jgi:hypothetical protein
MTQLKAACKAMPHDQMTADAHCMRMMHMSSKDMKRMQSCQAMDHDMMMKNRGCMKMMKKHPGMMDDGGMMKK